MSPFAIETRRQGLASGSGAAPQSAVAATSSGARLRVASQRIGSEFLGREPPLFPHRRERAVVCSAIDSKNSELDLRR